MILSWVSVDLSVLIRIGINLNTSFSGLRIVLGSGLTLCLGSGLISVLESVLMIVLRSGLMVLSW